MGSKNLNELRVIINSQAERKGWCREKWYLMARAASELGEFIDAKQRGDEKRASLEVIDVLYFLLQLIPNDIDLVMAFLEKYNSNEVNRKKTISEDDGFVMK